MSTLTYEEYLDEVTTVLTELYDLDDDAAIKLVVAAQEPNFLFRTMRMRKCVPPSKPRKMRSPCSSASRIASKRRKNSNSACASRRNKSQPSAARPLEHGAVRASAQCRGLAI